MKRAGANGMILIERAGADGIGASSASSRRRRQARCCLRTDRDGGVRQGMRRGQLLVDPVRCFEYKPPSFT